MKIYINTKTYIKALLVFALAYALNTTAATAQSFEFMSKQDTVIGTMTDEFVSDAVIGNISGSIRQIGAKMHIINLAGTQRIGFCWGSCFEKTDDYVAPDHYTLMAGQNTGTKYAGHLYPYDCNGMTQVVFTFFNVADTTDFVEYTATFIVEDPTGVAGDNSTGQVFAVYPNPASDWIGFNSQATGVFDAVSIYDYQGNLAITAVGDASRIDISGLPAGAYFICISQKGAITKRAGFTVYR